MKTHWTYFKKVIVKPIKPIWFWLRWILTYGSWILLGTEWTQGFYILYPAYQIFIILFITLEKIQLWNRKENSFCHWWLTKTWVTVLNSCSIRNIENHWSISSHRPSRAIKFFMRSHQETGAMPPKD